MADRESTVIELGPHRIARDAARDVEETEVMLEAILECGACPRGVIVILDLPRGKRAVRLAGSYARDRPAAARALVRAGVAIHLDIERAQRRRRVS
jgi:hypothetical protein